MEIIDLSEHDAEERRSPGGRYQLLRRNITQLLGGIKDVGEWGGGLPFDLEEVLVPPGCSNFPFHYHTAQTELYLIVSGVGVLRHGEGESPVSEGNAFSFAPGEPHQLTNTGDEQLHYFVLTDNPRTDLCHYPDSGKWFAKPPGTPFTMEEAEYYEEGD